MQANLFKLIHLTMILLMSAYLNANAGDLDDDIKMDEKIDKYDTLDRPGINVQYIKRRAKASVSKSQGDQGSGDVAIGGFINKPGAKVGDVTIVFDGEDINAISE